MTKIHLLVQSYKAQCKSLQKEHTPGKFESWQPVDSVEGQFYPKIGSLLLHTGKKIEKLLLKSYKFVRYHFSCEIALSADEIEITVADRDLWEETGKFGHFSV